MSLESLTGTKIYFSTGTLATEDADGYEAATWSHFVGCTSFAEWGDTSNDVSEPTLSEGRVQHANGVLDGGEVSIGGRTEAGDTGAAILITNAGTNTVVLIKKLYLSGDAEYAYGVIGSLLQREAVSDGVRGFTATARINSKVLPVAAD